MENTNNKKTTIKKDVIKKDTAKKTPTPKQPKVVEQGLEMTPEIFEKFQEFMKSQLEQDEKPKVVEKPKRTKTNKSDLRKDYADDYVYLSNCTRGKVVYKSSISGVKYVWDTFGSVVELPVKELLSMPDKFITAPYLTFSDDNEDMLEDLIKAYGVGDLYANIDVLDDIEYDVKNVNLTKVKGIVESLNKEGRILINDIASKIQDAIESGEIDSNSQINELSKILGKQFFLPQE